MKTALLAALCAALAAPALALDSASPAAPMPPRAQACAACHGSDGISAAADIPNLAGQKKAYLVRQLQAFRDGQRSHDLMSVIAKQLDPAELPTLADYWSSLPAAGQGGGNSAAAAAPHAATVSHMALPPAFPAGFAEYTRSEDAESKTVVVRYANRVALAAARAGQPLPDGAALISATYAAQPAANGGPAALGPVQSYAGMERRAGWGAQIPTLFRNGDWNYGLWNAQGQPNLRNLQPRCLACHLPKADDSYVFTLAEMRRAVP